MGESKEHTSVTGELGDSSLVYTPVGEIEEIFRQVRKGYVEGAVRSFEQRKHHLRQFLRGLLEEKAALLDAVYFDIHKPHGETELFEFGALEYEIGLFLDNMEKWARPERNPMGSEQPAFLLSQGEVRKEPRGTVVVVGAWNFPVRILLLPVVGALAAGNTVVIKPSELSPHTAQVVGRVIKHVDPQVMRVVQGGVEETTELLRHKFDHYFYTGNGRVGKIVAHAAAEHHAIVTLELGGKSPAVVHADVGDLKPTAARIMWAKLSNAGQTCVGVDYLLVHRSIKDKLVPLLIDAAIGMFGKSPVKSPDFGRIVNERHWNRLMKLLKSSQGNLIQITDDDPNENDR
ncbi:Hexadecenal dehydrogenase [Coemansia sp. RSA 1290]|nr:Hexadecenal dehydrogenase [Coemansia sp. RSA 1290]